MKKHILVISEAKRPSWADEIEKIFEVTIKKNVISAYKEVFEMTPDIVVVHPRHSYFSSYHMAKLLDLYGETAEIPIVLIGSEKVPTDVRFDAQLSEDLSGKEVKKILMNILEIGALSKKDKVEIGKISVTNDTIEKETKNILNEMLIKSSITDDFKSLIDYMSFENTLSENIFKIINKYLPYDIAGIFFSNSNVEERNIFNLSVPKKNAKIKTIEALRENFFDEMEEHKQIREIQCNLIDGDVIEEGESEYDDYKTKIVIPFDYTDKFTGGFLFCSKEELNFYEIAFFNVIVKELEIVYKLKYVFSEQANHALVDVMTGLYNKQEFDANLDKEFHRARRYIYNFTLAMLDIDYLSKINEEYGKGFGDFVIQELSRVLKSVFRRTDLIYRYGGEEIMVLLPETPITKSLIPIERLRDKISQHVFEKDGIKTNITVSVGLCANYSKFTEPEQLLDGVGTALNRAKQGGRNMVDIYE
jgi:diguanylate cyclase (GGDEF)-like protein